MLSLPGKTSDIPKAKNLYQNTSICRSTSNDPPQSKQMLSQNNDQTVMCETPQFLNEFLKYVLFADDTFILFGWGSEAAFGYSGEITKNPKTMV